MKRFYFLLFIAFSHFYFSQTIPSPIAGDFQTATSGNWNSAATWQVYNGTSWDSATTYPGQGTTITSQGTYRVFVRPGNTVTVNSDQTYYFGDVYVIGSPLPNPTSFGQITISGNGTDLRLLGTEQDVFIIGGIIYWPSNNTILYLQTGNSLVITNYNGIGTPSGYGTNGVQPEISTNCSGNRQIKFVDSNGTTVRDYAVCYSGNSEYTFHELNLAGGSIFSHPSVSPTSICVGGSVTLSGSYTGLVPAGHIVNYEWSLVSGPAGYTYTPPITYPAPVPVVNQTITPALAGNYVFALRVFYRDNTYNYDISSTENASFVVLPAGSASCACYRDPVNNSTVQVPSKTGITSLGRAGESNADNWPMQRQSGHLVLESNTKGFVINRVATSASIANPVEGMMVFDEGANCLKVYTTKDSGLTYAWECYTVPGCP